MITRIVYDLFGALEAFYGKDVVHTEVHDCSLVNIQGSAGVFVAIGSGAAMPQEIRSLRLSASFGTPFTIRVAADATAAASASNKIVVNRGEDTFEVTIKLNSGDKLWVRSLTTTAATSGFLTLNFMG